MRKQTDKSMQNDKVIGKKFLDNFHGLQLAFEIKKVRSIFGRNEWFVSVPGQLPDSGLWMRAKENPKFV